MPETQDHKLFSFFLHQQPPSTYHPYQVVKVVNHLIMTVKQSQPSFCFFDKVDKWQRKWQTGKEVHQLWWLDWPPKDKPPSLPSPAPGMQPYRGEWEVFLTQNSHKGPRKWIVIYEAWTRDLSIASMGSYQWASPQFLSQSSSALCPIINYNINYNMYKIIYKKIK